MTTNRPTLKQIAVEFTKYERFMGLYEGDQSIQYIPSSKDLDNDRVVGRKKIGFGWGQVQYFTYSKLA